MISIMQFGHSLVFLLITSSNAFSLVTHTSRFQTQTTKTSSSSLHVSSFSPDENMSPDVSDADNKNLPHTHIQINSRQIEFTDLGSIQQSSERQQRIEQEQENRQRFMKYGDDLWELRESMEKLSVGLLEAIDSGEREKEEEIRQELRQIGKEDPDLVYKFELEQLQKALMEGRESDARIHSMLASAARSCLPQYNLDGLWVGK
jgi:TolA-binding protein